MKTGSPTQIALSTKTLLFAGDLPRHGKLSPSNSQLESCPYFPCLQGYLKASCGLQLKSEQTNATIPTYATKEMHQVSNSDPPYPLELRGGIQSTRCHLALFLKCLSRLALTASPLEIRAAAMAEPQPVAVVLPGSQA